ncbi:hypothetical protein AJ88_48400 [Mesorhizobium amorphae CCBAU 01583]|nr:hypothetical protein AJ88_48400 [Mesorhizobium amorphae CCBAU 01583]
MDVIANLFKVLRSGGRKYERHQLRLSAAVLCFQPFKHLVGRDAWATFHPLANTLAQRRKLCLALLFALFQ